MRNLILISLLAGLLLGASLNDARQANEAYEQGDYAQAEQLYRAAIDAEPDNAKLYFNLGNTLVKQEKVEEALRVFEQFKAMTEDPQQRALADYNIGNIYTGEQQWDRALSHFKNALRFRSADEDAKFNYELARQKKQEQENQQNQNQDQNQDQQQDENQDQQQQQQQNQQQNQNQDQNQNQNQDQQQNQNQDQDQQQQQQQQQRPDQISREQAQKILQALEQKEKELLKEFKKTKSESSDSNNEKDW